MTEQTNKQVNLVSQVQSSVLDRKGSVAREDEEPVLLLLKC